MTLAVNVLKRVILPVAALLVVMIGLGLLITDVLDQAWPFTVEDQVNEAFADHRTGLLNAVTWCLGNLGSTPVIIVLTAVVAITWRLRWHTWREPLFLAAAVSAQAVVFFFTTLVIDRARPAVPHLDDSPPTSSFPSGHTSAAVALYVGLALVLAMRAQPGWHRALWWLLVLLPVGVAVARMYRGMHHPTDVTASFFNAGICLFIMARAILDRRVR